MIKHVDISDWQQHIKINDVRLLKISYSKSGEPLHYAIVLHVYTFNDTVYHMQSDVTLQKDSEMNKLMYALCQHAVRIQDPYKIKDHYSLPPQQFLDYLRKLN